MSCDRILFPRAREIAVEFMKEQIPQFLPGSDIPLLEEEYIEHEDFWIFFRNPEIIIPPNSGRIAAVWAYAVGVTGEPIIVPDHRGNKAELDAQAARLSKYYRTHDSAGRYIGPTDSGSASQ
jgi:hypothetical protein